jgi:hypothetical protein
MCLVERDSRVGPGPSAKQVHGWSSGLLLTREDEMRRGLKRVEEGY